jgi:hypothetical protein
MNQNREKGRLSIHKRTSLILLLAIPLILFLLLVAKPIPPVAGRVVDAITGRPIRDVPVTFQMSHYEGWSVHSELHGSTATGRFGWFFLSGALRWRGLPLPTFRADWLTINESDRAIELEEVSAATQVLYNPMSNRRGEPVGNKNYFPLTVTFREGGCDRVWAATCLYKGVRWGISLPLIPVLEDFEDCKKIRDSSLRERCRQLNTYRAAFAHVDTYEDAQRGKALCAQVDRAVISAECLRQLPVYMANPQGYERPMVPSPSVSLPEGMFAAAIGQVPRFNQGCGMLDNFTGHFHCGANYGPKDNVFWVAVGVEEWPDLESARKYLPVGKPQFADYKEATVKDEVRLGGKIRLYHGPQYTAAYWVSKNRFVQVLFYHPIPEQEQFISHYAAEFPSTLQ